MSDAAPVAPTEAPASGAAVAPVAPAAEPVAAPAPAEKQPSYSQQLLAWQKEKAALTKQIEELKTKPGALDEYKNLLENDPDAALEKLGLTFDKISERKLKGGPPEVRELERKVRMMEAERAKEKAALETERMRQQEAQVIAQTEVELKGLAATCPLMAEVGSAKDVHELRVKVYTESGRVVSVKEATEALEADLEKQIQALAKVEKARNYFAPKAPAPAPVVPAAAPAPVVPEAKPEAKVDAPEAPHRAPWLKGTAREDQIDSLRRSLAARGLK